MPKPQLKQSLYPWPHDELILPPKRQHPLWRRVLFVIGAFFFMLLGIIFWIAPIITGIPFWIAAFIMLAMVSQKIRRGINWCDRKLPRRMRIALRRGRDYVHRWRERWTSE